ncbi:MAG: CRISPR-associated endonuclease Cas2 [Acidimicrobiales bacterium]
MDVLLTYDIDTTTRAGARRLARVAKVCEGFGVRVQLSVFECRLSPAALVRLTGELAEIIDPKTDLCTSTVSTARSQMPEHRSVARHSATLASTGYCEPGPAVILDNLRCRHDQHHSSRSQVL